MRTFFLLGILTALWILPVQAQVYKWIDEKGGVHFSDDPTWIPERYRSSTVVEPKGELKTPTSADAQGVDGKGKDRLGRGAEYWRGRVEEWRQKLDLAQENLEKLRLRYNELTEKYNASRGPEQRYRIRQEREQLQSEMNGCKVQIEEAKGILEKKIPEEAQLFGAKPEWVKP